MSLVTLVEATKKDIGYGLRQLIRNPAFSIVAISSLAVGIGANTAIFSIMNAVLLKALPVRNPSELVLLTDPSVSGRVSGIEYGKRTLLSYSEFRRLREDSTSLELFASESELDQWQVRIADGPQEQILGRLVSGEYFSSLGVEPSIGRFFTKQDETGIGKDPNVVISYEYWQRRLGGQTSVLGTPINLSGTIFNIIGVASSNFHGETIGQAPDAWVPLMMEPIIKPGRDWLREDLNGGMEKTMWLHVFGRLKPGVTQAKAQKEVDVLFSRILDTDYPPSLSEEIRKRDLNQRIAVREASTGAFQGRDEVRKYLLVLIGVAALVLLIACANVANLLLARATARQKEVGIRLSIGAERGRLVRQFLTESLLLSTLGGILGLVFARAALPLLLLLLSGPLESWNLETGLDTRMLGFTMGVTLLTGILFGLAPALQTTRVDVHRSLKETGRGMTVSGMRMLVAKGLVAIQVALSLLVVVGAGLFSRTLWNLQSVELGYTKSSLLVVQIDAVAANYKDARLSDLYHALTDRLGAIPGVRGVTYSANGLFSDAESADRIDVEGFVAQRRQDRYSLDDQVGGRYFSVLGIPMLLGREIGPQDTAVAPKVCVINEAFAKRFFADRSPIGHRITEILDSSNSNGTSMEIVGVAKNARDQVLRDKIPPRFYTAADQAVGEVPGAVRFEIRTVADPDAMLNTVRKTITQVDAGLPILSAHSLGALVDASNTYPRMIARLCTFFGIVSLGLAAIGLYGVMSYRVGRRTNEIGIRMALGAGRGRIIRMMLMETCVISLIGLAVGFLASWMTTGMLATQLYGLSALDPLTIFVAFGVLSVICLLSGYIPAMRAAGVNVVKALRQE
jgi:predicted permease